MIIHNWQQLKSENPKKLNDTIKMMHHAAQAVAAFGNSLLPKASDDSQSNMSWNNELKAIVGQEVNLKRRVRMALVYPTFKLHMLNADATSMASFPHIGANQNNGTKLCKNASPEYGRKSR